LLAEFEDISAAILPLGRGIISICSRLATNGPITRSALFYSQVAA